MTPHPPSELRTTIDGLPLPFTRIEHYLAHWAARTPHTEAVVDSSGRLSYAQLQQAVLATASAMSQLGVTEGTCVAVLAPPSIDFLISLLASASLGAVWLGLNPKYTLTEMQRVVEDARPRLVLAHRRIGDADYSAILEQLRNCPGLQATHFWVLDSASTLLSKSHVASVAVPAFPTTTPSTTQQPVLLYVYTSGTTGTPKAARLTHQAIIRAAAVRARAWSVSPFRSLNNLPINHVGSVGDIACTTLVCGGCMVCLERFSPAGTLRCIEQEQVSFWYQVPTMFQMCLDLADDHPIDWSALQAAVWSGGRASETLIRRLARVAPRLGLDYSMTESVGAITLTLLTSDADLLEDHVGWPDPGRNLRLVDPDTLEPVSGGQAGEVQICDPWMFDGYRGTVQGGDAFAPGGWFRTGDLAVQRPDGAWRLVGRSKEMFKSGGYNVYPREVELAIESHPDVRAVAVVAIPDALYGEVGVAYVVGFAGFPDASVLEAHCRQLLANYKIPKRFVGMDALPMLPIGKVDKVALREAARNAG